MFSKKTKFLSIIIGFFLILIFIFFEKPLKSFFYSSSLPLQKALWQAGDKVSGFFEGISGIKNQSKENNYLKSEVEGLLAQIASLQELKKENEKLREALSIGLEKDFKLEMVSAVGKDVSGDVILINKGAKDGLKEGLPLINSQKIIYGKISEVSDKTSKVILISDPNSSFDGAISGKDITGLVKGKGNFNIYFDLIPKDKEFSKNDLVVTSKLSGTFPAGLLVGEIVDIVQDDVKPFKTAGIKPFLNINDMENLFVIKEW